MSPRALLSRERRRGLKQQKVQPKCDPPAAWQLRYYPVTAAAAPGERGTPQQHEQLLSISPNSYRSPRTPRTWSPALQTCPLCRSPSTGASPSFFSSLRFFSLWTFLRLPKLPKRVAMTTTLPRSFPSKELCPQRWRLTNQSARKFWRRHLIGPRSWWPEM